MKTLALSHGIIWMEAEGMMSMRQEVWIGESGTAGLQVLRQSPAASFLISTSSLSFVENGKFEDYEEVIDEEYEEVIDEEYEEILDEEYEEYGEYEE